MKRKILIIEDDQQIREVLHDVLELENYHVTTAENGLIGIKHLEDGLIPDVILLDIYMPVMGGQEFRQEIQIKFPHLIKSAHLIFMTAAASGDIPKDHDANKILMKPMDIDLLMNKLRTLTEK